MVFTKKAFLPFALWFFINTGFAETGNIQDVQLLAN